MTCGRTKKFFEKKVFFGEKIDSSCNIYLLNRIYIIWSLESHRMRWKCDHARVQFQNLLPPPENCMEKLKSIIREIDTRWQKRTNTFSHAFTMNQYNWEHSIVNRANPQKWVKTNKSIKSKIACPSSFEVWCVLLYCARAFPIIWQIMCQNYKETIQHQLKNSMHTA